MEEPSTFAEAKQSTAWKKAMQAELDSIEENGTWELSKLPAGQREIWIKWAYWSVQRQSIDLMKCLRRWLDWRLSDC
jgi:hypothetical protein